MPRLLTLDHVPLPAAALLESDATRSRGSVSEAVDAIVNAALAQHAAQVRANASTSTPFSRAPHRHTRTYSSLAGDAKRLRQRRPWRSAAGPERARP